MTRNLRHREVAKCLGPFWVPGLNYAACIRNRFNHVLEIVSIMFMKQIRNCLMCLGVVQKFATDPKQSPFQKPFKGLLKAFKKPLKGV